MNTNKENMCLFQIHEAVYAISLNLWINEAFIPYFRVNTKIYLMSRAKLNIVQHP